MHTFDLINQIWPIKKLIWLAKKKILAHNTTTSPRPCPIWLHWIETNYKDQLTHISSRLCLELKLNIQDTER